MLRTIFCSIPFVCKEITLYLHPYNIFKRTYGISLEYQTEWKYSDDFPLP